MTTPLKMDRSDLMVVRAALDDAYEILDELGRGGMAIVYRARDRALDREVAIKVLPFSLAFDVDLVERFQREARLSAQLEHPHIVPIYRVGRSDDVIYFVMKLLRGQSLSARLEKRGRMPASDVQRMLIETAGALGHAHRRGIVHRDVKPDNIMLDEDGRCVVTDFGIARSAAESKLTATGMSIGTPRYMSPEQARAREVDGRSDLYSLGVVGYECLVGHVPFDGADPFAILMHHVQSAVPRPTLTGTDARRVYGVIERLLAKAPEDRFASAEQLIEALRSGEMRAPSAPAIAAAADRSHLAGREPASSAVLDSALDAGIELLRQQRPHVEAGIELLKQQRPRLESVVDAGLAVGRRVVHASAPHVRRVAGWIGGRTVRFWKRAGIAVVGCGLAFLLGRYALLQRSRCPQPGSRSSDSGAAGSARAPFDVRLDPPERQAQGRDLDVYYDVCGLAAGSVKTRLVVTRQESGLKRFFTDVDPVVASFDDEIGGPRARRHHAVDFEAMPAGSYVVDLVVHDGTGRRRSASADFQVGAR